MVNQINLELGCGNHVASGWVGMDKQSIPTVDIVHNLEDIPWPLPDSCVMHCRAVHVLEHVCPRSQIAVMNEIWRVMVPDGLFELNVPLAGSGPDYWNPEHCAHFTARSWELFDPRFEWYLSYKPKPWQIVDGYPIVSAEGAISVMLKAMKGVFDKK